MEGPSLPSLQTAAFQGAGAVAHRLILHPVVLASHLDTTSCPSCSTSTSALDLWFGKATEHGSCPWDPVPLQQTQKKLLVPSFSSAQLSVDCCSHLGSDTANGRPFSPFLLSVKSASQLNHKSKKKNASQFQLCPKDTVRRRSVNRLSPSLTLSSNPGSTAFC